MTKSEILRANKSKIVSDYYSGKSTVKIGKEYDCNPGLVHGLLEEFGVAINKCKSYSESSRERYFCLIEYMANHQDKGQHVISKELRISKNFVKRAFKTLGIDSSGRIYRIEQHSEKIIKWYSQGFGSSTIAEVLGCEACSVILLLKRHKVEVEPCKKYTFKENILDDGINTPELAYMFGLWLTDGNVMKDKIRIQMCDLDSIEKCKKIFEYDGPLYRREDKRGGRKTMYELCINSTKLSKKFVELGCPPNKTHIVTFPEHIPENLWPHFIRGAIEGDGSIRKTDTSITGNLPLLEGVMRAVIKYTGLKQEDFHFYCRHPKRKNNIRTMMLTKSANVKKFLDWIYMNGNVPENIRMNRKFSLYKQYWKGRVILPM